MPDLKAIVADMYAAFGRGDVPAILERLAPDVQWEDSRDNSAQVAGVPWMQPRRGREGAADFFKVLSNYKFPVFEVKSILAGEREAVGVITLEIVLPNGTVVRDEEMHLFTFNEKGQVVRFRHYLDTAKAIAAAKAA